MKLRILTSAFACGPGGSSGQFGSGELVLGWNVVKQLSRFHQVWVLTHTLHRASIEDALRADPCSNLQFHYVNLPGWLEPLQRFQGGIQFYAYLWQLHAYFVARRLHRRLHFDVFHHVTYANDWMASFVGALLPIPYIRGPGGGAHRTPGALLPEYSLRDRLWERFRSVGQWLFRHDPFFILGQSRARAILVCNREALEAIPRRWRHKAHLFPVNGVSSRDLRLATPAEFTHPSRSGTASEEHKTNGQEERFQVLSAGKLLGLKGFCLAIRAFRDFVARHPQAEFTIIGEGPELPRLETLVRQAELQDRVRFENWMAREKLLAAMGQCDVFLFPSLRDGGGAVVVEAMAAGKPVICLDLAGPGTHVTGDCGIRITPSSPEQAVHEIAAALDRLYADRGLRLRMGSAGRERALRLYHWDRLGERLMKIYEDSLDLELGGA